MEALRQEKLAEETLNTGTKRKAIFRNLCVCVGGWNDSQAPSPLSHILWLQVAMQGKAGKEPALGSFWHT